MNKETIPARKAVCDMVNSVEFDSALVVFVDRTKSMLQNWYHFSGHPENWTAKDLRHAAWLMSSATTDLLKEEKGTDTRKLNISPKRAIVFKGPRTDTTQLFAVGIGWPNIEKRLWIILDFATQEILLGLRWWKANGEVSGEPHWAAQIIVGPLQLQFSRKM